MQHSAKVWHQTGTSRKCSVQYAWHTCTKVVQCNIKPFPSINPPPDADLAGDKTIQTMSTKPKLIKYLVALYLSKQTPTQVIATARHIVGMMSGNAYFPNPTPSLSDITKQALVLEQAYNSAITHVKGSRTIMLNERKKLLGLMKGLAQYVELTADANQVEGNKIISSAGMTERKTKTNPVKSFMVSAGKQVGSLLVQHPAVLHAIYIYEMSTDPKNPASWAQVYIGHRSKFTVLGLTSGTRYYLRAAMIVKEVKSAYSPVRDFVVQ